MNWQRLSHLAYNDIRDLQNTKLRSFVRHKLLYAPYYRELFAKNNLSRGDIRTTDDLIKIPFTSKADLAPSAEEPARPRAFILQPNEHLIKKYASKEELAKIILEKALGRDVKARLEWEYKPVHLHFTTGRSALPTPFSYSSRDLAVLKETGRRLLDVCGVSHDLLGINGFPYSPHLAFWLTYYAMTTVMMTGLPTGGGKIMGTAKIIDAIERLKAQLLTFIPGYCYHLLRQAVADDRDFSSVRYIMFGGERVSPGMRDKVRELLAQLGAHEVQIFSTYAMTESKTAWIQCAENTGYHLYPDLEFFEVVDKEGNRVKEGPGELVYSALDWRGSVVVRYKTGDMTQGIEYAPCPHCGKTVPRILPDLQRSHDVKEFNLTKVKGEFVNLNNFYPLLSSVREIDEWQVEIAKRNNDPFEVDEILVRVAYKPGVNAGLFQPELVKKIEQAVNVGVTIIPSSLEDLLHRLGMETELKEKRIIDSRPKG